MKKFIQSVFSVTNSANRKQKIITILGQTIKLNRKPFKKDYRKLSKKYKKTISEIKNIVGTRKIRVAFYVNDDKWKCQNLYDLLLKDEHYEPFMVVGRSLLEEGHIEFQDSDYTMNLYNFYKAAGMQTYLAWDFEKGVPIGLDTFKPDVIFYSRQWRLYPEHNVKTTSEFALTCYVPYFISNSPTKIEAGYGFHNTLWRYYVINKDLKNEYAKSMQNAGKNLKVVGYPNLDSYLEYKDNEKKYVIYAPHWSVGANTMLNYATFDWSGLPILEFAKQHPEINWLFKPHPRLKKELSFKGVMSKDDVENYWAEWDKIGFKYEGPDYIGLFKKSKAMITDCGSFLAEYMPSKNPVILLRSSIATPYNFLAKKVTKYYYKAHNTEELSALLDEVILNGIDKDKEKRLKMLEDLALVTNASQNILNDLNKEFGIKC